MQSMLYTIGMAVDRAAEAGYTVRLLIGGQWVEGLVAANDGVGIVLECLDGGHVVAKIEHVAAVRVLSESPYRAPIEGPDDIGAMPMPGPMQVAMRAALDDDDHVHEQQERYRARRTTLRAALEGAGFRIDHSHGALYLWATRDEPCWDTVADLADRGILVAPGDFYGAAGERHVRIALTATDERIAAAADRLTAPLL